MESWRKVWREGFAKVLSVNGLKALLRGLREDDVNLTQQCTTVPPPLRCSKNVPVERCCAVAYCGWKGEGLWSVGVVDEYFAGACFNADMLINEPASCRHFLEFFDDTPRDEMRNELIPEVERAIKERETKGA